MIPNKGHPENMQNTIFITVAHLNGGAFNRKCIVN